MNLYILAVSVSLLGGPVSLIAHTSNEATLFPDIKSSQARFDVILLVAAGIIPETDNFHPDNRLTRLDLAAWGTLAKGLAEAGNPPNIKALAGVAMRKGLIKTVDGDASYEDINKVIFMGRLEPESPGTVPSRAEAAEYITANLNVYVEGETLLARKQMQYGPTGRIEKVESKTNPDGGNTFYITVDGMTHAMYTHGKVANGPVDLKEWQGRTVRRSIIRDLGQFKLWLFLEAADMENTGHQHPE
jgi:hypothetical protein